MIIVAKFHRRNYDCKKFKGWLMGQKKFFRFGHFSFFMGYVKNIVVENFLFYSSTVFISKKHTHKISQM